MMNVFLFSKYRADPKVLTAIMFPIIGFFELKRYQGWKETGTSGFLNSFPYDPLNQNSPTRAVNEVKNGRLAMVAFIGFCVQALVTREGPLVRLCDVIPDEDEACCCSIGIVGMHVLKKWTILSHLWRWLVCVCRKTSPATWAPPSPTTS